MSYCVHLATMDGIACKRGIDLRQLAGGGTHYQVLRLPCIPLSNRRGEVAQPCQQFEAVKEAE